MKKLLIPILMLIFLLSSCTQDKEYEIKFNKMGGNEINSIFMNEGDAFEVSIIPEKTGYSFSNWYLEEECSTLYTEIETVDKSIELFAKWTPLVTKVNFMYGEINLGGGYTQYGEEYDLPTWDYNGIQINGFYSDSSLTQELTVITGAAQDQYIFVDIEAIDANLPIEDIDLTELPYFSYLNNTNPVVTITVENVGEMTLQLFPDVAPNTVNNFINYIQSSDYSGSTFHRVISEFMIQGGKVENTNCPINGDFTSNGFDNDLVHYRGVLSMARTSIENSATSQFFIVHKESSFLNGNYATFGALTSGFNVLDYIAGMMTVTNDKPLLDVVIESITINLNGYIPDAPVCAQ